MFSNKLKTQIKAATCVFLVFCLSLFTLSGCNNNKDETIIQVENYKLDAALYKFILLQNISGAQYLINASSQSALMQSDLEKTISEGTIEDKPAVDWIKEQSIDTAKTIAAIHVEFDKLGLTLSDEDESKINDYAEKMYDSMEKQGAASKLGITKEAFKQLAETNTKSTKIHEEYFGEGKSRAISNEKVDEYTKNHGLKYKIITIEKPLSGQDEILAKILKNEGVENIKALVDKYMGQVAAKKSIDDINAAYNKASEQPESPLEYTFQYDDLDFIEKEVVVSVQPNSPITLKEDDAAYYIIQRFDIDQESIEKQREVSKKNLLSSSYDNLLSELKDKYDIKVNQSAVDGINPIEQAKLLSEIMKSSAQQSQQKNQNQNQSSEEAE